MFEVSSLYRGEDSIINVLLAVKKKLCHRSLFCYTGRVLCHYYEHKAVKGLILLWGMYTKLWQRDIKNERLHGCKYNQNGYHYFCNMILKSGQALSQERGTFLLPIKLSYYSFAGSTAEHIFLV